MRRAATALAMFLLALIVAAPAQIDAQAKKPTPHKVQKSKKPKQASQNLKSISAERKKVLKRLRLQMTSWDRVRDQRIPVVPIKTASPDDSLKKTLTTRYKGLIGKRRSNRRWDTYWENEKKSAGDIKATYRSLVKLYLAERTLRKTELTRLDGEKSSSLAAVKSAKTSLKTKSAALVTRLKELTELKKKTDVSLKALQLEEKPLKRALKKASRVLEAAKKANLPEPLKKAEADHKTADQSLKTHQKKLAETKTLLEQLTSALETSQRWQDKELTDASKLTDKAFKKLVAEIATLHATAATQTATIVRLNGQLSVLRKRIETLELAASLLRNRQKTLSEWIKLATDKSANQDVYLSAINTDIRAVRERMNKLSVEQAKAPTSQDKKKKKKKKSTSTDSLSPYAQYKSELKTLEDEKLSREIQLQSIHANLKLVKSQISARQILAKAQKTDLDLFQREVLIIQTELKRVENDLNEKKADSVPVVGLWSWQTQWKHYNTKAEGKREKLNNSYNTTLSSIDGLNSDLSVFDFELKDIRLGIERMKSEIEKQTLKRNRMLWSSVWYWIKMNAWQIPFFLFAAWLLLWLTSRGSETIVERARKKPKFIEDNDAMQQVETLVKVGRSVAKLVIYIIAGLGIVASMGVNISPLLGAGAIFGLAISFGSQNLVRDVVTGFFILLENQYAVGDVITVGGLTGTVEQITMRRTVIRSLDGTMHNVPNGSVSSVSNMTQGWSRAVVHVGVGYESDLRKVKQVCDEVGLELWNDPEWRPKMLEEAPKYIGLTELGDSALTVRVMGKTITGAQWGLVREMNLRLKEAFDAAGINIPFPQRDVHIIQQPAATGEGA